MEADGKREIFNLEIEEIRSMLLVVTHESDFSHNSENERERQDKELIGVVVLSIEELRTAAGNC